VTSNSERRTLPVVTYTLIGLNVLMFLVELGGGDQFIDDWAFIPAKFAANPGANAITIFSARLVPPVRQHAVPMDLRGQRRRPVRASQIPDLLFARIAATLAQFTLAPHSGMPNVGASGAPLLAFSAPISSCSRKRE